MQRTFSCIGIAKHYHFQALRFQVVFGRNFVFFTCDSTATLYSQNLIFYDFGEHDLRTTWSKVSGKVIRIFGQQPPDISVDAQLVIAGYSSVIDNEEQTKFSVYGGRLIQQTTNSTN